MILLVVILVLFAQNRYFQTVEVLGRLGRDSTPSPSLATATSGTDPAGAFGAGEPKLEVTGPATVAVAKASEYTAKLDGQPATEATWTINPPAMAKVEPGKGASVKVTPAKAGAFKVTASVGTRTATLDATAQAPAVAGTVLPFIGGGWGSIIVSILVATIVAVLGLARVLDGQAIASLYGALVGYLFGVRTPASGGGGGAGGGGAGAGSGAGGSAPTGAHDTAGRNGDEDG